MNNRNWKIVTVAGGTTELAPAVAGKRIKIKNLIFSTKNACKVFLNDEDDRKLTNDYYFGANGGISSLEWAQPLNIVLKPGKALEITCSVDPETDMMIEYDYFEFPSVGG